LTKAERYRVYLVSNLPAEDVRRMRMIPAERLEAAIEREAGTGNGFIMPRGAGTLPRLTSV